MIKKYVLIIVVIGIMVSLIIVYHLYFRREEIKCPKCGSMYVWTPLGTRSENFLWRCLECNNTWIKTYSKKSFDEWKDNSVNIVIHMVMKYISKNHEDSRNFISEKIKWRR
ncbi:MAG TPA: hypothetical protein ENG40_04545, partial [Thermoprotei archaeon]|nr:hypothetical protein [Thermoprotei archaeon]